MNYYDFNAGEIISLGTIQNRYGHRPSDERLADLRIFPYVKDPTKSIDRYELGPVNLCGKKAHQTYVARIDQMVQDIDQITTAFQIMRAAIASSSTLTELIDTTAHAAQQVGDKPFHFQGFFPLYVTEDRADYESSDGTSTTHVISGITFYMPNAGVTRYTGDYEPSQTNQQLEARNVIYKGLSTQVTRVL